MPISILCPGCKKKLKAKDELAGKRLKCPSCGHVIVIPDSPTPPQANLELSPYELLARAVEKGNGSDVANFLHQRDLILIETPEESGEEGTAAMTAEIDDCPMLVAFTSMDHVHTFGSAMPDMLDADGCLGTFEASGADFLAKLPDEFGVLLNPETDDSLELPPELMRKVKLVKAVVQIPDNRSVATQDPRAQAVREQSFSFLQARGFRPVDWLPLTDMERKVRPAKEVASRLLSLASLFTWVSAPESAIPTERVKQAIQNNRLRKWFTNDEAQILALRRSEARKQHGDAIGWKLENMWPLAWVVGFEEEPTIEASQIGDEIIEAILIKLLASLDVTVEQISDASKARSVKEVIALEDRFYCAHNAIRSAQLGNDTVPEGFDPIVHGGAVHERRHALTWCLSPDTGWDETDLST